MNTLPPDSNNELDGSHVPPFGSGGIPLTEAEARQQLLVGAALIGVHAHAANAMDRRMFPGAVCFVSHASTAYDWPENDDVFRYYTTWLEALEDFLTLELDTKA